MKKFIVELDDRCARDLERVAPSKLRMRSEFVRLAVRRAVDLALDRATAEAYLRDPLPGASTAGDLLGWDVRNELAVAAPRPKTRARRGTKRAA